MIIILKVRKSDFFWIAQFYKAFSTNTRRAHSNFNGCEFSLELLSPDILVVFQRNMEKLIGSSTFSVRVIFLQFERILLLTCMIMQGLRFALSLKAQMILIADFDCINLFSIFYFFIDHHFLLCAQFLMMFHSASTSFLW